MLTERERIQRLKEVLISHASSYDLKHGNYKAIQAVQKMAGHSSEKDYVYALCDGLKYGNWPWVTHKLTQEDFKGISDTLDDAIGEQK
jgi:hypothetical protein